MHWNTLNRMEQLEEIRTLSETQPVVIFKHSTRCSISSSALDRLERHAAKAERADFAAYFLDLIAFRPISNAIADQFGVEHQSPQVLLIKNGKCLYNNSHMGISFQELQEEMKSVSM